MREINIYARIRRNKLDVIAGECFRGECSIIVRELNRRNKQALLGIQNNDGLYTIIGKKYVYYLTNLGVEGEISHSVLLDILTRNALHLGKTSDYEFLYIDEVNSIWIMNTATMNALWNTILFLNRNNIS